MAVEDHLLSGIIDILAHDNQNWHEKVKYVKKKIDEVLSLCPQIEYTIVDGNLMFNLVDIHDARIKDLLKCYRKIAVATSYSDDIVYKRALPKIKSLVENLHNASNEKNPWMPVFAKISSVNAFIEDLRSARITDINDTIALLNDRGRKCKYLQVYKYDFKKVAELDHQYKSLVSIYKNWCLYQAYGSIYVIDRLLVDGLISVCKREIDVTDDENECYGAIMSCLTLLDKFLLFFDQDSGMTSGSKKQLPRCVTYLLELCIELIGIYMLCHEGKDMMRTAECHVNRARLNDRFYYRDLNSLVFVIGVLRWNKFNTFDPTELKALYIFDMDSASHKMPYDFEENYDYRMSANMMHQHRQVVEVLPEGGDVFETSYQGMLAIGMNISDAIKKNSISSLDSVLNTFGSFSNELKMLINELYILNINNISPYVYTDKKRGIPAHLKPVDPYEKTFVNMDKIVCISYTHQFESYTKYGKVKAKFIPIYFKLDFLLEKIKNNVANNDLHIEVMSFSNECEEEIKLTAISNITVYPDYDEQYNSKYSKIKGAVPEVLRIHLLHTKNGNMIGMYCYGTNLRSVKHKIDRGHLFLGIPVTCSYVDDHQIPETMLLTVNFIIENDINL